MSHGQAALIQVPFVTASGLHALEECSDQDYSFTTKISVTRLDLSTTLTSVIYQELFGRMAAESFTCGGILEYSLGSERRRSPGLCTGFRQPSEVILIRDVGMGPTDW